MSERPKEGVYLEAALGVIGEQVSERIDEISRRRRRRAKGGVVALAVATVLSGSLAAAAVTGAFESSATGAVQESAAWAAPVQLRCVEGTDAQAPAFFTASYRAHPGVMIDAAACAEARTVIGTDAEALSAATPDELVIAAEGVLRASAPEGVQVVEASFGRVSADALPQARACLSDGGAVVLLVAAGADAPSCREEAR